MRSNWKKSCASAGRQKITTRDKVSLRMNALVTFQVSDAAMAVSTSEDHRQALHMLPTPSKRRLNLAEVDLIRVPN
jgi:regulator of protease activity HflC (stomatin/prohibitin superfamily)